MFVTVVHPFVGFNFHYVLQCDSKRCPSDSPWRWRHSSGMCQTAVTSDIPEENKLQEIITWQRGQRGRLRGYEGPAFRPSAVKVLA